MRRGLLSWSKTEIPQSVFDMRVAQAQAAMASDGIEALIVYTNHTRPAAVSWLTGFIPYWSESLLVVPRVGRPALAAALSKRVHEWIAQTSWIGSILAAPRVGREIGKLCAKETPGRVGVLELDLLPTQVADDLAAAGASNLVDATPLFDRLRLRADGTEIALTARAAQIACEALGTLSAVEPGDDVAQAVAAIEGTARRGGAEEVYVAVATDLREHPAFYRSQGLGTLVGRTFSVRLTVAYKGHWIRLARTVSRDPHVAGALQRAAERFADVAVRLPDPHALSAATSWLIEGTVRSQPLQSLAESWGAGEPLLPLAGKVVTLSATFAIDGLPLRIVAPLLVGSAALPGALLATPIV